MLQSLRLRSKLCHGALRQGCIIYRWFGALHDRDCGLQTSQPRLQVLESVLQDRTLSDFPKIVVLGAPCIHAEGNLPTTERQLQFAQSEGFVGMHLCLFLKTTRRAFLLPQA